MTSTEGLPSTVAGRMAPVGQEAIRLGISHILDRIPCWIFGGMRCTPRMAISEQCTAPHMFRQQARAMRSLAGRSSCVKWSNSASITLFTNPEASVAAEWQCTQPCVCTMLLIELLVPPTGNPNSIQLRLQRRDLGGIRQQELDIIAAGEAQIPAAVFVGQCAEFAYRLNGSAGEASRREPCTACRLTPPTWQRTPGATFSWYFHLP